MKSHQEFFAELKRRKVFKVTGVYGVVAFGLLQVADPLATALGLPDTFLTYIVALLLLGFPVALVLAWAFEVTPDGMQKTEAAAPGEIEAIVALPVSKRWPAGLMALLGVGALIAGAWWVGRQTAPEGATALSREEASGAVRLPMTNLADDPRPSIAVLPFADMSPDGDQEYFSDGMAEEILNVLAKITELRVAARTSTFALKDQDLTAAEWGDTLRVAYLIEGSVRKSGNQVRITAQLIDTADGSHLWTDAYTRPLVDVFQIQAEIAEAVAQALTVPLGLQAASDLVTPTADLEAYDLYLAGRARMKERGPSLNEAIRLFEAAIARDSTWAPAWAGLAEAKELLGWYPEVWGGDPVSLEDIHAGMVPLQEASENAARRALELDPNIASAHVALGSVYRNRNDWEKGEAAYLRALSLDPDNGEAYQQYAELLSEMGRIDEGLRLAERAVAMDRLPVRYLLFSGILGSDDRLDEAIEALRTGIKLDSEGSVTGLRRRWVNFNIQAGTYDSLFAYGSGFRVQELTEEHQAAVIEALRNGDPSVLPPELEEVEWAPTLLMALGQSDEAVEAMRRSVAARPFQNTNWTWGPIFDPIREHPVFLQILKDLDLEGAVPQRTPR